MSGTQKADVILIGYEDQENLGLRSIASYLFLHGISVEILPCKVLSFQEILNNIRANNPKLIGFSLIFQRMLFGFAKLIDYLRKEGIKSHFTIGGHFPTIDFENTLKQIPGLDTVVRHEGEESVLDLYKNYNRPDLWKNIPGIAFRENNKVIITKPRPLVRDLDSLPFVVRQHPETVQQRGIGLCSMIISRGCYYDCAFCSIRQFYRDAPGPKRRSRSPANVVAEMDQLFQKGVRYFRFNDDDFGMKTNQQKLWIEEFASLLERKDLADRILWRISCRIDEIDRDMVRKLREVGLAFLYLGIESGSEQGLKICNKKYSVMDIRKTLQILEEEKLLFDYGFMLFDPYSTFTTIHQNLDFLEDITKNGRVPVHFTKMFPYVGTPIASRLKKENRLIGPINSPDYNFLDPRLDLYQHFVTLTFHDMLFRQEGLGNNLQNALFDACILKKFYPDFSGNEGYATAVHRLIDRCNISMLETLRISLNFSETKDVDAIITYWHLLEFVRDQEVNVHRDIREKLRQAIPPIDRCMNRPAG